MQIITIQEIKENKRVLPPLRATTIIRTFLWSEGAGGYTSPKLLNPDVHHPTQTDSKQWLVTCANSK
jgi:hypothetical protein